MESIYSSHYKSVDSARLSVDNAWARADGRSCLQCCSAPMPRRRRRPGAVRRSGAPESHLTGFADPPEDWPAAIPSCDAAAVTTRESKSAILARKLYRLCIWECHIDLFRRIRKSLLVSIFNLCKYELYVLI